MVETQIRLQEGEEYVFEILKRTTLPGDEECFVLKDPFGKRHLLTAEYYDDYGFRDGLKVKCKVDKVNCNGRIFLEPEHPYYSESEVYDFEVLEQKRINEYTGELFSVVDVFKNVYQVFSPVRQSIKKHLKCKVDRIKKGKLHLFALSPGAYNKFEKGKYYKFNIKEVIRMDDGFRYYLLEGPFKYNHLLDYELYTDFGFRVGQDINCLIVQVSHDGEMILEPEHPMYKIGGRYTFRYVRFEEIEDPMRGLKKFLYVLDDNDFEHSIMLDNGQTKSDFEGFPINCQLDRVKKGKLFLSLIE